MAYEDTLSCSETSQTQAQAQIRSCAGKETCELKPLLPHFRFDRLRSNAARRSTTERTNLWRRLYHRNPASPRTIIQYLHLLPLNTPRQNFVCRELMPAVPTYTPPGDLAAGLRPSIEGPVMSAAAPATHDSPFVFFRILAHVRLLCWISSRETRFRRGGASIGWWTPPSVTPCIEAATAQPTRQSSQ